MNTVANEVQDCLGDWLHKHGPIVPADWRKMLPLCTIDASITEKELPMSANAELFNVFVEAKQALEELPVVRADLKAAHELIDETNAKLTDKANEFANAQNELASLRATLAQREAEVSDLTFRHGEAQKVIEGVRSLIPGLRSTITDAVDSVGDKVKESTLSNESKSPPSPDASLETSHPAHHAPSGGDASQSQASPPAPEQGYPSQHGDGTPLAPAPTPPSNDGHSGEDKPEPAPAPALPYVGQEHWRKPHDISWSRFGEGGGEVPGWVWDRESH